MISAGYENMKRDAECEKWGGLGVINDYSRKLEFPGYHTAFLTWSDLTDYTALAYSSTVKIVAFTASIKLNDNYYKFL